MDFDEKNMAQNESFALELARLEGRLPVPTSERVSPEPKMEAFDFSYSGYVIGNAVASTNAVFGGGDSGHGYETRFELSLDEGDFALELTEEGPSVALTIRAGGCDEALALARLLELAGVSLRRQIEENSRRAATQ
jgi:hypothetical protein